MRLSVPSAVSMAVVLALLVGAVVRVSVQESEWSPSLTPDGQPDIQGVWTNFDPTPFEAPSEVDIERLAPLAKWFPGTNLPPSEPQQNVNRRNSPPGERRSVSLGSFFFDGPGSAGRNSRRRSMVVDPPTGRIPVRESAVAVRNERLINLTDSWLNHTEWERCITRGVPGGIFPPGYGAGYRIIQSPGYVVIQYEMIHEARIIPLYDHPPLPSGIRLWNGHSRGRWQGNTLVVEVSNYNDKGAIATNVGTRGARGIPRTQGLKIVERFRFADADTIEYEVTIEDPEIYTAPWKVAMPLNKDSTYELYEYACHEGNYGLENSLSGGRAEDHAAEGR